MMKRLLLYSFVLFSMFLTMSVYAQDKTVSGKVTSKDDGTPLPGVTVMVKGTTVGTQTDVEGTYKITVPANGFVATYIYLCVAFFLVFKNFDTFRHSNTCKFI